MTDQKRVIDWNQNDWLAYDQKIQTKKKKQQKKKPVIQMERNNVQQNNYEYQTTITNRFGIVEDFILVSNSLHNLKIEVKNRHSKKAHIIRIYTEDKIGTFIKKGDGCYFDFGHGFITDYIYSPQYLGERNQWKPNW